MTGAGKPRVLVAGAQTGGHLMPARVLGNRLQEAGYEVTLVATGAEIEQKVLDGVGLEVEILKSPRWKGMRFHRRVFGLVRLPGALVAAIRLVRRVRPDVVVGFGGSSSGLVCLAAALLGVPMAFSEPNSVPGFANRLLAPFARRIFVAYEQAERRFPRRSAVRTGTPVRPEVLEVPPKTYRGPARRVLVFGGSQGSAFLNERIPRVLAAVCASGVPLEVLHQTGLGREGPVREAYAAARVPATVQDYLSDMAAAYRFSDFVISRSGAATVAEVTAIGIPALFVPFALAADDHQTGNARPVAEAGGALMVEEREFDDAEMAHRLAELFNDPGRLQTMAERSRSFGRRDALDRMMAEIAGITPWPRRPPVEA